MSLYHDHRPRDFASVLGQERAVKTLESKLAAGNGKFPKALLLVGASGTGKTTIARILRRRLGCGKADYQEVDCPALEEVLGTVRSIERRMRMAPTGGKCRIWFFEEVQALSRAPFAQQAMLRMLEEAPDHVRFILATTDPSKLQRAIITRCTEIKLEPLSPKVLLELLASVGSKEGLKLSGQYLAAIVEASDGSARMALNHLDRTMGLPEDERIEAMAAGDPKRKAFDLVRELVWGRASWKTLAKIIEDIGDDDWERLRYMVLTCASKELLKADERTATKAQFILTCFEGNWFDSKRNGLVRACREAAENIGKK